MDGNGRNREISGSNTAMKNRDDPKKIPKGMATRLETIKPTMTRRVDAMVWAINWPLSIIFRARDNIFEGAGMKSGSIYPNRHTTSHTVMNISSEIMLMANDFAVLSIFIFSPHYFREGLSKPSRGQ
jgi:hypothetical protein